MKARRELLLKARDIIISNKPSEEQLITLCTITNLYISNPQTNIECILDSYCDSLNKNIQIYNGKKFSI